MKNIPEAAPKDHNHHLAWAEKIRKAPKHEQEQLRELFTQRYGGFVI